MITIRPTNLYHQQKDGALTATHTKAQRNLVFFVVLRFCVGGYKKVFLGAVADAVDFDGSPRL
jgi:hypothetical protein